MNMREYSIAAIPGDGIGPEVTAEALKVLRAALPGSVKLETTEYDLGAKHWHATGETLTDAALERLRGHDAILPDLVRRRGGAADTRKS